MLRSAHPFGGKQRYVCEVLALWHSYGHEAVILSMDEGVRLWGAPAKVLPRLAVDAPNPLRRAAAAFQRLYNADAARLTDWLRDERFDVAHLHDHAHFSIALLDALERAGVPIVYTLHDYQLLCPVSVLFRERERVTCEACRGGRYWNAVRYHCCHGKLTNSLISSLDTALHAYAGIERRVQQFIAPSEAVIQAFRHFGWRNANIVHLPHFVRSQMAVPPPRFDDASRVLCVARLWNQKGVDVLLQAAARLKSDRFEILIVGDGPRYPELQALAAALGLPRVRFLGHLDAEQVMNAYTEANCVVVPSIWPEVFGLVALEAFVARRPVIASRIGGLAEIVDDSVDGWLVPPGDVESLADRLDWMLSHPAQAAEMGEAGYNKAITQYTPERHYAGLRNVYNQAVEAYRQTHR